MLDVPAPSFCCLAGTSRALILSLPSLTVCMSPPPIFPSIVRRWRWPAQLLCVALTLGVLVSDEPAEAFVRTKTCDRTGNINTTRICRPDQQPRDVYWENPCVTYYVNRKGSRPFGGLSDELLTLVEESFATWENVSCGNVRFALGGLTCNENVGREDKNITGGNQNLIVWEEENWEYATDAIAITVVSPNPDTGEILDADIVMNGQFFVFANLSSPNDTVADVRNTLTHEIGHFIGFNHETSVPEATMYPDAQPGELIKRDLHDDDIQAVCTVYPSTGSSNVCLPSKIEDRTCTLEYGGEIGCATSAVPLHGKTTDSTSSRQHAPAGRWATTLLTFLLGLFFLRRRTLRRQAQS